ncbi:MAG: hypothetical protein KKC51_09355, partial [Verrucomicrobia bacterium]|nr:hypothetical protein [Verrucomicrobiota bacterium]
MSWTRNTCPRRKFTTSPPNKATRRRSSGGSTLERTSKKGAQPEKKRLKSALRRRLQARRAAWSAAWVRERSAKVCRRLAAWRVFRAARVIAAYRARPGEVRLEPLLRAARS